MNFTNIKIRTKLLLGFGAIGIMVITMGWLAFYQTKIIWQKTSDLYNHPFMVSNAVSEIQTSMVSMHRSLKDVILSADPYEMRKYINQIDQAESRAYQKFEVVYNLYLGNKSTVDSAYSAFSDWKGIRDSTIMLVQEGKFEEAAFRTTHAAEAYNAVMTSRINILRDFAMKKAADFYRTAEIEKHQLTAQLWLIIGLIFIITMLIGYSILAAVNKPLRLLRNATEIQRQGNYAIRCEIESTNEMGQLADSFNRMADGIEKEIVIKTGITEISDSMLGKDDLREFGKSLMRALLTHTKSNNGALYVLNDETSCYDPKFTIGLQNDKVKSFSANSYEGEFGRTLLEKKIVVINNISDDTLFSFPVVTGILKPNEILNIPILLNDRIIAVVSLATLGVYSVETLEMLKIAEKNLTAGLSSILAFQKNREYAQMLDQQNVELLMQSKELKSQTEELHEQNAELEMQKRQIEVANTLKSEFLSSMSHELRTPLNAVIALSGVLNRKLKDKIPEDEYSYLEIIERNGKNLLTLINEILDLSKIEAGKVEVSLSEFSLNESVESILDTLHMQIRQKNIQTINKIKPDFELIYTDRSKCHHILQNLIGNAVKFTDSGIVEISSHIHENEVHIVVRDTGIGMSPDQLPHIFNHFHQIDGTASRKHEGTGLGLAIADKYSRLLSGRIEVASEPGKGSVFTLILPILKSGWGGVQKSDNQFSNSINRPLGKAAVPDLNMTDKNILIIEDSEPAIIQLTEVLGEQGYHFVVARTGMEALELVKAIIPDAIILDLMMPGMDGFEVLENIRSTKTTARIPVLILTAKYLNKSELNRLTANNIHQLVQKGDVGKDELLNSIRDMLGSGIQPDEQLPKTAIPVSKQGRINILLVEDNADNVKTIEVLLDNRCNLIVALDGQDGIDKAVSLKPDLILLDISLPVKDGFMVLEEIRQIESLQMVPVIAVTARAMKGDKEHFLKYGFDDYISKPVGSDIFEETLKKWILELP